VPHQPPDSDDLDPEVSALADSIVRLHLREGSENRDPRLLSFALNSVNNLIPERQDLVSVRPETMVLEALATMRAKGFSQLPVLKGDVVLGSFSFRSFAQGVVEAHKHGHKVEALQVADCLEQLQFARVTDELRDLLDQFDQRDAVFVGDPARILGIATAVDALRFLYRLASPFVLLQEIELALRFIISTCVDSTSLAEVIRAGVGNQYLERPGDIPSTIQDLTFSQYRSVICARDNYRRFAEVLGPNRSWTQSRLHPISDLRNDVMHFRRDLTVEDYGVLTSVREWLFLRLHVSRLQGEPG
jgi:predicted transcriptional regulator